MILKRKLEQLWDKICRDRSVIKSRTEIMEEREERYRRLLRTYPDRCLKCDGLGVYTSHAYERQAICDTCKGKGFS